MLFKPHKIIKKASKGTIKRLRAVIMKGKLDQEINTAFVSGFKYLNITSQKLRILAWEFMGIDLLLFYDTVNRKMCTISSPSTVLVLS